jgi:ribonuclease HI
MVHLHVYIGVSYIATHHSKDDSIGNGGYGIVLVDDNVLSKEIAGGYCSTTNARMYIMALIELVKHLDPVNTIEIYLNNGNILDTFNKGWLDKWNRNHYVKIKHSDLWRELYHLIQSRKLMLRY